MSTRALQGLVINGDRLFQYCHSDGYPDWLGRLAHRFAASLLDENTLDEARTLALQLLRVSEVGDPTPEQRSALTAYWREVSTGDDWYSLLRGAQGHYGAILSSGVIMSESRPPAEFRNPSGWSDIEWSYQVDLDALTLTVWLGEPTPDDTVGDGLRFPIASLPAEDVFVAAADGLNV